ncbi:MAG: type IV pilus twitching motility protein PilT [Armatimonadota bacterium]|nr:type IV pilus twitching motility protein PilT [Armatimonadota bacterium]MDR7464848.1 type IV pilus twitching motility protein PilT [Armatimonadota bacterium]MDR7469914.1 type IV pilus twitching motility protein PilT [Armatimonadota bacterium]MDR7474599.1 type IV pilus twitching motility protein PilT [Armatimonadota bacterium]MDR7539842.1 type IV pilus twitching motility protein PilT [Armatimonadota bacterium]
MEIHGLLKMVIERNASDLHLKVKNPPILRINGHLIPVDLPPFEPAELQSLIESMLTDAQRETFRQELELDFGYSVPGLSRFRVNVFRQRGHVGAAIRAIPMQVPTIAQLHLPAGVERFAELPRGMVLVTGPTGSGKSTTLAALINHINQHRSCHVVTIEDPIEYLHHDQKSIIDQREVGSDTHSFAHALRHVLRQDPDVILIGEMRDLETIATAITAAETGHLVFATLHTQSAAQAVERIVDVFPPYQQEQVRMQLSLSLEGVLSQTLLPRRDGRGRVAAVEVLRLTPAVRNLIREGKTFQLPSAIQSGAREGMQTLNQALRRLVEEGLVSYEEAAARATNPQELDQLLGRGRPATVR